MSALDALRDALTVLPGRVAVLTDDMDPYTESQIALPDAVRAKLMHLDIPPYMLTVCTVVGSGLDCFKEGDRVGCLPMEGFWINHEDKDVPDLGALVPKGRQLRLFRGDVLDTVLVKLS